MQASRWIGSLLAAFAACAAHAAITPSDLHLERWPDASTTFSQPIAIRHANDGSGRVFVIERCSAIRIVKNGVLLATPFLSISPSCSGEQGILGLAFDPDYTSNGTFYVTYTAPSSDPRLGATADQVLARYTVSPNPDVANPTGTVILRVPDIASNHNGGDLHFDTQGYINWSMGDGGVQGDPNGFAQCTGRKKADSNPGTCHTTTGSGPTYYLLGKIIRLDVHHSTASAPANFCGVAAGQPAPYAIPPGNPFVDVTQHPDECAEIFNWGFRNPFRFSFDRQTGDMLIGDVGQNQYEEIDLRAAGSNDPPYYGWHCMEGTAMFNSSRACTPPIAPNVLPLLEYTHAGGRCAVTGGYRYRGPIGPLRGTYVYADSCSSEIFFAKPDALGQWSSTIWRDDANGYGTYSGFGEDEVGNLYVANTATGVVYRFASSQAGDTHTVTPQAGPGGVLSPATPQVVDEGDTVAFDVQADPGHAIDAVDGCGGVLAGTLYTTAPIVADCTVAATFAPDASDIVFRDGFDAAPPSAPRGRITARAVPSARSR